MRNGRYPFEVALQQSCFPPTTQQALEDQTLMQICMCQWLDTPCWKWMRQVDHLSSSLFQLLTCLYRSLNTLPSCRRIRSVTKGSWKCNPSPS